MTQPKIKARRRPDTTMLVGSTIFLWAIFALIAVVVLWMAGMLGDYLRDQWYKFVPVVLLCGVLALCLSLQVTYRSWRFRGRIFQTDDGFELDVPGDEPRRVAWGRIQRVTAWEVSGWQRVLYAAFAQAGDDKPVEVHDRDAGFDWLAEQLPHRLPGVHPDWPGQVHVADGPVALFGPAESEPQDERDEDELSQAERQRLYGT